MRRHWCDRGQSTVEFALLVPFVIAAVLLLLQVAVVVHAQLAVTQVAREVARTLAVDPDADIDRVVAATSNLTTEELTIVVEYRAPPDGPGRIVLVHVSYTPPAVSMLFGRLSDQLEVSGKAAMLIEA